MLRELKDRGMNFAILSNGTPDMLAAVVRNSDWKGCSMRCCRSRKSASTNRIPRSMAWLRNA